MIYKSDKPYPIVKVEKENKYYAKLLLKNYSGKISENTAIHLYLYQALVSDDRLEEYKMIMNNIARVEMTHLDLLGEIITLLGELPVYGYYDNDNNFKYWNSNMVRYNINLKDMLEIDIYSEIEAINNYKENLSIIKDHYVKDIIKRIIEDEEIHLRVFINLYHKWFNN